MKQTHHGERIVAAAPAIRPHDIGLPRSGPHVLIVHPNFGRLGGIETYLRKICAHFTISYSFCGIARRRGESGLLQRIGRILEDYLRCWKMLGDPTVDIMHLNPSLEPKSFLRESVFMLMAQLRGKRTLVFFHGWKPDFERWLSRSNGRLFGLLYGRADAFVVLSAGFAAKLRDWRVTQPIHCETTVIGDDDIKGFDLEAALEQRLRSTRRRILFASRLMRTKGVDTAIRTLALIQRAGGDDFELVVAGSGEFEDEARALAARLGVRNVSFLGALPMEQVYQELSTAHVLCFPTRHDEGFPNIIVEAMAFGVPVVSRPVGGIRDFFEPGVHGFLTESIAPEDFARLVRDATADPDRYRAMARASRAYAERRFLASRAAARLETIYGSIQEPSTRASEAHSM